MDKLKIDQAGSNFMAQPLNTNISGAVVIPATYNNRPVTLITGFGSCLEITSVTIPVGPVVHGSAFANSAKLTSVTFQGSDIKCGTGSFPGDLYHKYIANGAGTYTRSAGSNTWTKVGGFTLNGTWKRSDGMEITISENGQSITITGNKPDNGGRLNDTYTKR